jgi:hypothetical protein
MEVLSAARTRIVLGEGKEVKGAMIEEPSQNSVRERLFSLVSLQGLPAKFLSACCNWFGQAFCEDGKR